MTIFFFGMFHGNVKEILKINNILNIIDDEFYFDVDKEKLVDYALMGMTMSTDDKYTSYYPREQFEDYISNGENSYIGIGVVLGASADNKYLEVVSVIENSPAANNNICTGDIILEVNDMAVGADDLNRVASYIKKDNGSASVKLKIKTPDGNVSEVNIERKSIEKDTVKSKLLFDDIGYVKISAFDRKDKEDDHSTDTYDEFCEELEALEELGATKIVLDLRNNPGGDLNVVSKIADYLLPEGIITYTETKSGKKNYIYSDKDWNDVEMVVLVNGNSASASEVLTVAIKDYERAVIVGTTTYGKGIVQSIYNFNDGSGMSLTTSKYYSPKGTSIHEVGITPDYKIELPESLDNKISDLDYDEDIQLQKAVELLK